ncbi:unnamed protein product [Urochloa humidicola]
MERTTSCSSAAGGISSTIVKQADGSNIFRQRVCSVNPFFVSPRVPWWSRAGDAPLTTPHRNTIEKPCQCGHAQSFLSPPSFIPPHGGLICATDFGSRSATVADSSLSIHEPTATSQSLPSSYFPTLGMVDLQVPATTPLPAALGAQPWQGIVLPSGGLVSAPGFGSGSTTVGDSSLSVHGYMATSQFIPLSFFPKLDMMDLQMPTATPLSVALGGQPWQGMAPPLSSSLDSASGSRSASTTVGNIFPSVKGHAATPQSLPSSVFPVLGKVDLQASVATPFSVSLSGQLWEGMVSPPYGGLVFAPGFGSGSTAVGDNSIHGHVATSGSVLSSLFPMLGMLDLQAPGAAPLPAALGGQPWQGLAPPPSRTALGLPTCPSQSAALEQMAAWQQSEMPFFLPVTVSSQPPLSSSDNHTGFAQPSSNYELPPLPLSLRIPPLEEESTYSMLSTIDDGTIISWHYGDSSMGTGSSLPAGPNLTAGDKKMKAPMPPLMPPSSQGVGAGSSNFIGFAQPSLNSELAALRAGLQAHLHLPVKQEPISNKEDRPDQDAILRLMLETSIARALGSLESTKVAGSTPCQNYNSTPKLSQPLTVRAGASSSRSHATGVIFTDAEREIIRKDMKLQVLMNADPKRVKRMLSNRMSAAKRKAIKDVHILELESKVETLERKRKTSSAELQLVERQRAELEAQYKELIMTMQEMEQQGMLKDAVSEKLQAQIQTPDIIKFNELQMSSQKNKCVGSSWFPPTSTQATDGTEWLTHGCSTPTDR